jgi:SDR family mycofactocin-dependent oxidoreductase
MTQELPNAKQRKVAFVTGAARGIGAACARQLASDGWNVVLVDACVDNPALVYPLATTEELFNVVDECGIDRAMGIVADVRDQRSLDEAVSASVERFGKISAAVAAAGAFVGGPFAWQTEEEAWRVVMDVNLDGTWRTARAVLPTILDNPSPRHGRFVAVASAGAVVGIPRLAAYTASKHGVVGLVRSMAAELGPYEVTANAVAPGSTETAMLQASAGAYGLSSTEEFAQHHMIPRLLSPEEVAALVCWLCSESSSGVTGAVLPVDAGLTAR